MKKIRLIPVILSIILTVSCNRSAEKQEEKLQEEALETRTAYLGLTEGSGSCLITADYGDRVYNFDTLVQLERTEEGLSTTLTLTSPEEIAGITVTQVGNESQLLWEDIILETGDLNENGLSPVNSVGTLLHALEKGYIDSALKKEMFTPVGNRMVLELSVSDPDLPSGQGMEIVIWVESESQNLLGGEIYQDGARVITCQFSDFIF